MSIGRKPHIGKVYNKEKTKKKLISSVGKILVKDGHSAIRINKIESVSGVTKKLIYDYFGGLKGLVKAYLSQIDFWKIEESKLDKGDVVLETGATPQFMNNLLRNDFEYLMKSQEMQKIILWGISEKNKSIKELTDEREKFGELIFAQTDNFFVNSAVDYRATVAIFASAIYYMALHISTNGSTMCGIDMSKEEGQERIFTAMERLLKQTYKYTGDD